MTREAAVVEGPRLAPVQLNVHTPKDPGVGRVVETRLCTASTRAAGIVRHVAIDVSGSRLAGAFRAGQSFGVIPAGLDAAGKEHKVRLYSIASPTLGEDGAGNVVATTVKRTLAEHWETHRLFVGLASNWLCDLQAGDEVRVTGPAGKRFVLPEQPDDHDYLFVATGTGIAPFRGMVRELLARASSSRVVLIAGTPYASDLLYDAEFRALASTHERFAYWPAISRHPLADGTPAMYADGWLTYRPDFFGPLLESPRTLIYLCGIAGMEVGLLVRLIDLLGPERARAYVSAPDAALAQRATWTRQTMHGLVRPTPRVMVEVY